MSTEHNSNTRLEAFCDGVFAIAITLLVLEIKIPSAEKIHSVSELWLAIGRLWPYFFAFVIGFGTILIAWVNHHSFMKLITKGSPQFLYANGFFLLTIVIVPFPTALIAEYMRTEYAQPAIIVYCLIGWLHNLGWNLIFLSTLQPKNLAKNDKCKKILKDNLKNCFYGLIVYTINVIVAFWYPWIAISVIIFLWMVWLIIGIFLNRDDESIYKEVF